MMSTIVDDGDVVGWRRRLAEFILATDGSVLVIPRMEMSLQLMMQLGEAMTSLAAATGVMMGT